MTDITKKKAKKAKKIMDPIHGLMEFDDWMVDFIDTRHFQRLRNIKQLGTTYYVYPGACHNRFEHSLGVAHLANTLVKRIHNEQPDLNNSVSDEFRERNLRCVTLAGLCHDLGHGPFSHIFESCFIGFVRPDEWEHEKGSEMMFEHLVDEYHIDLEKEDRRFIIDLIHGNTERNTGMRSPYLFDVVANKTNSIDVDKFDYLARDCHYLGMKSAFDYLRLMKYSRVINGQIVYNFKESYSIYELFHTRYSLHKKAYNHRVGKAIDYMIRDALIEANSVFKISESIDDAEKYLKMDDTILNRIEYSENPSLKNSQRIIKRIRDRDLYKFADGYLVPDNEKDNLTKEKINEDKIAEYSGLKKDDVIVDRLILNYGNKKENPIDNVQFFDKNDKKDNPYRVFNLDRSQISYLTPDQFEETNIRIFAKDPKNVGKVREGFIRLLKEHVQDPKTYYTRNQQ